MLLRTSERILDIHIKSQPDDLTCGPTCLHSVYQYYHDNISLEQVIEEVKQLETGGTLAVLLGNHALMRKYSATIFTFNLHHFDPSWFTHKADLKKKLAQQVLLKPHDARLKVATDAYLNFLENGGSIRFEDLAPALIKYYVGRRMPILTGLSATYLYESPREIGRDRIEFDDLRGDPAGHFVIINGYRQEDRMAYVADPLASNPLQKGQYYKVGFQKLINAVMLGVMTYDANLLIIHPRRNG